MAVTSTSPTLNWRDPVPENAAHVGIVPQMDLRDRSLCPFGREASMRLLNSLFFFLAPLQTLKEP